MTNRNEETRRRLLDHYHTYPKLQITDLFKYLFQSTFGCEHLVSDQERALAFIEREYDAMKKDGAPKTDPLDGDFSRAHLSFLNDGLTPKTLTALFCLSAKESAGTVDLLEEKLAITADLVDRCLLPFTREDFDAALSAWRAEGYPAVHHSEEFRAAYHPAYRVIANRYVRFLPLFSAIDRLLARGNAVVAIEGGSASGKSTLAATLCDLYDCNLFHTDDFFLRPEQRTEWRLKEVGGNLDRERFLEEIVEPLRQGATVLYRPFNCSAQRLEPPIAVTPKSLTVVEGVYSMHPAFGIYYDLSVLLEIGSEYQKRRIASRNTPALADRFYNEWIPLENVYFSMTAIEDRVDLAIPILPEE